MKLKKVIMRNEEYNKKFDSKEGEQLIEHLNGQKEL